MARDRFEKWTCDRCGATETVPIPGSREYADMPKGWGKLGDRHVCTACSEGHASWWAQGKEGGDRG